MQFSDLDRLNCLPGRKIRHLLLRLGSLMPKEGKALPKFAQVVAALGTPVPKEGTAGPKETESASHPREPAFHVRPDAGGHLSLDPCLLIKPARTCNKVIPSRRGHG